MGCGRGALPRAMLPVDRPAAVVTTGQGNASIEWAARERGIEVCGNGTYPRQPGKLGVDPRGRRNLPGGESMLAGLQRRAGAPARARWAAGLGRLDRGVGIARRRGRPSPGARTSSGTRGRRKGAGRSKKDMFARADVVVHVVLSGRRAAWSAPPSWPRRSRMRSGQHLPRPDRRGAGAGRGPAPGHDRGRRAGRLRRGAAAGDHPLRTLPNVVSRRTWGTDPRDLRVFYRDAVEDVHAHLRGAPVRLLN